MRTNYQMCMEDTQGAISPTHEWETVPLGQALAETRAQAWTTQSHAIHTLYPCVLELSNTEVLNCF